MKSDETMGAFADSFIALAQAGPIDKITIAAITQACGKNRKTFYYHFVDKNHLVVWIFRRDLADELKRCYPEELLLTMAPSRQAEGDELAISCAAFPCYVRNEVGFCSLDQSEFFLCMARTFDARRALYREFFKQGGEALMRAHFKTLYRPAFLDDCNFILGNRYLKPDRIAFLADFFVRAFIDTMFDTVNDFSVPVVEGALARQGNLVHDSMRQEIEKQYLIRSL